MKKWMATNMCAKIGEFFFLKLFEWQIAKPKSSELCFVFS